MKQASSRGSRRRETAYDPDQDPEERRALRRDYRDLHKITEDAQSNELTPDQLAENVRRADLLFDKVKGTSEATLDSQFLLRATQMGAAKARAMKSGAGAFDVDDFLARLVTFMGGRKGVQLDDDSDNDGDDDGSGEPLDWERIGRRALAKSRRVPVMDFMLGPLSIEQKKRNAVKRSKLEKNKNDEKKPQEITEDDITRSENETTKNVATIEKILDRIGQVNLFKFIVNPNDFGQSVENLFYLSFLFRDGKCALDIQDAEPIIYTCQQPSEEQYAEGLTKQQLVMEFDMATWRHAIEVFNITELMIPQRPKSEMRLGGKWYG